MDPGVDPNNSVVLGGPPVVGSSSCCISYSAPQPYWTLGRYDTARDKVMEGRQRRGTRRSGSGAAMSVFATSSPHHGEMADYPIDCNVCSGKLTSREEHLHHYSLHQVRFRIFR